MSEKEIENLVAMFRSSDENDVLLARELLRNFQYLGKGKYKKKSKLLQRIHKELKLPQSTNYKNIFTFKSWEWAAKAHLKR